MSGETRHSESGWTVDTAMQYIEQRFTDSDKAIQAALLAAKEAVAKAENASEKRFDAVNEFRGQLADQASTLLARNEYTTNHKALEDKINDLAERMNRSEGLAKGSELTVSKLYSAIGVAIAAIGLIVALANGVFIR